jgi:hypothetical protein
MYKFWFHFTIWAGIAASLLLALLIATPARYAAAQAVPTDTPGGSSSPFITNIFEGEPAINVRVGPSTILYPAPCGTLPYGGTAPALGTSPAHEWIEISFGTCPGGVGWVYAANVQVTGALHAVELPPTPAPLATQTIDPTLAAAFNTTPTSTRLPTFTPPPPLSVPQYPSSGASVAGFPLGVVISVLAALGAAVLGVSFFTRR